MAEMDVLAADLRNDSRSVRQRAAAELALIAKEQPESLIPVMDDVLDALMRPEARTRWECLDVLSALVPFDAERCVAAIPDAEYALFDETSGPLRYSAARFLCVLGATSEERSVRVWPVLDQAIQCYHGDIEFEDMLVDLIAFARGTLDSSVKAAFKERMAFDAENPRGVVGKRAQTIIAALA